MLRVEDLTKSHPTPIGDAPGPARRGDMGRQPVLTGARLTLGPGDSAALLGESGSGKSTLLHLIAGLDRPDSGAIWFDDPAADGPPVDVAALSDAARAALRRSRIGLVFQQFNLIASLSVADNIAFQARLSGRDDPAWRAEIVERLGLSALLGRYPEQLSGGQQQRVAVARAVAARPALLLADEPTGNLDAAAGDAVVALALETAAAAGAAVLMATHSRRIAGQLSRQVVIDGGRILEHGDEAAAAPLAVGA